MTKFLIEHGADVNAKMENGLTALHQAVTKSNYPFRFENKQTSEHLSFIYNTGDLDTVLSDLIEHGADDNLTSEDEYTPTGVAGN